jgi:hypothetical protein
MLDLVDEPLDQVSLLVEVLVVRDSSRAGAVRRDDDLSARVGNGGTKAIGVVALVSEQVFEGKTLDQALCLGDIGDLTCRQDEADRIAESIDGNADLRAQAAARTPDCLIFASPFLAPAACWCARTMVESMIRYSRSGFSPSSSKSRFQTPFFAHRRKRLNTLFHLPNSSGKSRHGAPARTSHNTASTNRRLSSPCRPLSPFLPVRGAKPVARFRRALACDVRVATVAGQGAWALAMMSSGSCGMALAPGTASRSPR